MSGEHKHAVSGWTVDTLKEYVEQEIKCVRDTIDERDRRYAAEREAMRDAATQAAESSKDALMLARNFDNRMELKNNEFRQQLKDTELTYIPRHEAAAHVNGVRSELMAMVVSLRSENSTQISSIEKTLSEHAARMDRGEGRSVGANALWGYILGAIGALVGIVALIWGLMGR